MADALILLKWIIYIAYIAKMNISAIDLNLLKVFDAIFETRNVTRAGDRIGLAQPSMSNALSRLRRLFGDDLFVRTPKGMVPTPRAEALAPLVTEILDLVHRTVAVPTPFDPATAEGDVVITTSDNVTASLGVPLIDRMGRIAPNLNVQMLPLNKAHAYAALDDEATDLVIGTFADVPARFCVDQLYRDDLVCIARVNHPALGKGLSVRRFADLPHVLMTLNADRRGVVDDALKKVGLTRRVVLTVPQFLTIPEIVRQTDYIAAIPRSLAHAVAARCGCAIYPVPVPLPSWWVSLIWTRKGDATPMTRMVVEQVKAVASQQIPRP